MLKNINKLLGLCLLTISLIFSTVSAMKANPLETPQGMVTVPVLVDDLKAKKSNKKIEKIKNYRLFHTILTLCWTATSVSTVVDIIISLVNKNHINLSSLAIRIIAQMIITTIFAKKSYELHQKLLKELDERLKNEKDGNSA